MSNLSVAREEHTSIWPLWVALATAIMIALAGVAILPRSVSANTLPQPVLLGTLCNDDTVPLVWRTGDDGQTDAPEGWKVERTRHDLEGNSFVQTLTFVGADADAPRQIDTGTWTWRDTSVDRTLPYTYRVRAINADGSEVTDRVWSNSIATDCFADSGREPGISLPVSQDGGFAMLWRGEQIGLPAPEGWKVERRNADREGNEVLRTFTFIGPEADVLLVADGRYWRWVDTSADLGVVYTYRVRAVNADSSDLEGRNWSRSVSSSPLESSLKQPGLSVPQGRDDGVWMYWHTGNRREFAAPQGWKVERRHWDSGDWVVQTFTFIGAQADALQTINGEYWDWVDTTATTNVEYTYRVRAINADGSDVSGRVWSRRAPVECVPAAA